MGVQAPPELLGIHTNMPSAVPPEIFKALQAGAPRRPASRPTRSRRSSGSPSSSRTAWRYAQQMANHPQTLYGIADSPVGLAAWFLDHDLRSYRAHRARLRRATRRPHARRRARQHHALLADQHGDFLGASLLGEQASVLRPDGRHDSRRRERLPGRALSGAAELGGAGVSQAHPLQQARQGRPLRGLGTAALLSEELRAGFRSLRSVSRGRMNRSTVFSARGGRPSL